MAFSDPIAEFLTRLRNAAKAQHRYVDLSSSKMRLRLLDIMKQHGFIENYLVDEEKRKIRIFLRYTKDRSSVLQGLRRISTPGLRRYVGYQDIPKVFNGMGLAIVSTPKGGVVDGEMARNLKTGGEFLCTIW